MKTCASCQKEKPLSCFHNHAKRKDGKHPYCKECRKAKADSNKRLKEYRKEWYARNKSEVVDRQKSRYQVNKEEIKAYKQQHYEDNKEYYKDKAKQYYEGNKHNPDYQSKRLQYQREWRARNRHVVAWRSLLTTCLKRLRQNKSGSTQSLLGYSANDLKEHIECLWLPGMSWDNYGEWHIDHIRPVCDFDPQSHPSVVNSLLNLRPLWATTRIVEGEVVVGNLNRNKRR